MGFVVLALLPLLGLALYNSSAERARRAEAIKATLSALAADFAARHEQVMERSRDLLLTLSTLTPVRERDAPRCNALFAELLPHYPQYLNLVVADNKGDIYCSARPMAQPVNVSTEPSFTRALANRGLALGEFGISKITGRPFIGQGYPVSGAQGEVVAVVGAILSVDWLNQQARRIVLPAGGVLAVIDAAGTVIVRAPEADKWVGRSVSDSPLFRSRPQALTYFEAPGPDGVARAYGLARVDRMPAPSALNVAVGVSLGQAFAPVQEALWRSLAWLALLAALALAAAWWGIERAVTRPLRLLVDLSRQITAGERQRRVAAHAGAAELVALGGHFNAMLDALAQSDAERARLSQIIELTSDIVTIAAHDGALLYANQAARALFGLRPGDNLAGRSAEQAFTPQAWQRVLDEARPGAVLNGLWSGENVLQAHDGHEIAVLQMLLALKDERGEVEAFAAISRDISQRKRDEQEIRALNQTLEQRVAERTLQLERASRAKSDFLANMSHELRTPLNAIIGFSEMLKEGALGSLGERQARPVGHIFDAGIHLLALINDILDLSKVEAGMLKLDLAELEVRALLQASLVVVHEAALARRIDLRSDIDSDVASLHADEIKLKQMLYNLLSNAVKFSPDGGRVLLCARRCRRAEVVLEAEMPARVLPLPAGPAEDFLAITVQDSGAGIAPEHLAQLFEPFVQVDSSASRRRRGTGLGLALVRRMAQLHGGTVGVASRLGEGSRFCLWLPYPAVPPPAPPPAPPPRP